MNGNKIGWREIFGPDADLYFYSKRHGCITSFPRQGFAFLEAYEVQPVADPVFKRKHLPSRAKLWLIHLLDWRFGFSTFDKPFPLLSYWSQYMHLSMKDLCRVWRGLAQQGLLDVPEGHRQGRGLRFGVEALLNKLRAWLRLKPSAFNDPQENEPEEDEEPVEKSQPEEEPEEEGEEELPPAAALERAQEWDWALEEIKDKRLVSRASYMTWFVGTRAYKWRDYFIIEAPTASGARQLQTQFNVIELALDKLLAPSYEIVVRPARPAARSA